MSCNCGRVPCNYVISQATEFTGGNLVVNLPNRAFINGQLACIIFAQAIPDTTTINAPVVFTIGTGTVQYPFLTRHCVQITASQVSTRTIYPVRVNTDITNTTATGAFVYVGRRCLPRTDVVSTEVIDQETAAE